MSDEFCVKFWGVRGSHPVPGESTVRYGGNTACVEVRVNGHTVILDTGTGAIGLGKEMMRRTHAAGSSVEAVLLYSHMHHDHIQGFPFFVPAFVGSSRLHMVGPGIFERELKEMLALSMIPPAFPVKLDDMNAHKTFYNLRETDVILLGETVGGIAVRSVNDELRAGEGDLVRIRALRSYAHPNGGVLVYRIEYRERALVYATDTEGYANTDRRLANFAKGADVLIHDAQYTEAHYLGRAAPFPATQGWGHSTAEMACEVARLAGAKRLVLFHHEPQYDDRIIAGMEAHARENFPNTLAAYEGLEMSLNGRAN